MTTAAEARQAEERAYPGAYLIVDERIRQVVEEGWSFDHDDEHGRGELTAAAVQYARYAEFQIRTGRRDGKQFFHSLPPEPSAWPWEYEWWKPDHDDPIRNLVKAGALIAAEIDRLRRVL